MKPRDRECECSVSLCLGSARIGERCTWDGTSRVNSCVFTRPSTAHARHAGRTTPHCAQPTPPRPHAHTPTSCPTLTLGSRPYPHAPLSRPLPLMCAYDSSSSSTSFCSSATRNSCAVSYGSSSMASVSIYILFPYSFRILVQNRVYILEYDKNTAPNRVYILQYSLYSC